MSRPQLILHDLDRALVIKTRGRTHKIPADDNILDAISNVPLFWTADLALQPAQDPAKSILHEHLTPNMDIRNQYGVDLVARPSRPVIRNLRQDNILSDQQLP